MSAQDKYAVPRINYFIWYSLIFFFGSPPAWENTFYLFIYFFQFSLSNLLIIREEKAKESTTVKEIGKYDINCYKNLVNLFFEFLQEFFIYIKHARKCFIRFPDTLKLV